MPSFEPEQTSEDRRENPTEITDVELLHPEDFAELYDELTTFQRTLLLVIQNITLQSGEEPYGLAIKAELETILHVQEIHHARLYPNLDTIKERGLITKKPLDKRANAYQLTPKGKGYIKKQAELELGLINGYDHQKVMYS